MKSIPIAVLIIQEGLFTEQCICQNNNEIRNFLKRVYVDDIDDIDDIDEVYERIEHFQDEIICVKGTDIWTIGNVKTFMERK